MSAQSTAIASGPIQSNGAIITEPDDTSPRPGAVRPHAAGKFLFVGDCKLWVRGVTYGTFAAGQGGDDYPGTEQLEQDFRLMAANGINTVRTYTVPPRRLLDAAARNGLWVMVGIPWEQHVTFLDDGQLADMIIARSRAAVRDCVGHPALLAYAIGNEIPAPVVRWHGRRRVERFLRRLFDAIKGCDPGAMVTYVVYPTTEYLELPFLDLVCFNVYLEARQTLETYLARLQNLVGERPLVMAEMGLDSLRNGADVQATTLDWQIRSAFDAGCAGTFVFAWTDEWHRGGHAIEDWDFGLTTRDREAKPALAAVREAFAKVPFPRDRNWPRISVVICSYNGERTIRDTMEGLLALDYPSYEVIVIDDGSTDGTAAIASEYPVQLHRTENRGLSAARNLGWEKASGEIVAYTDDDAYPDPHWLTYLAHAFLSTEHVGIGGPNIAPAGDGFVAACVANSPGGPVHVLVTDTEAEHIPGCNMAWRRTALEAIGGFDARYRAAADDVDLCWRMLERGGTIGFHPGAVVWHHRRNSLRHYWKQQVGYGKAEALLEAKWPDRYNALGHVTWGGRLYGRGLTLSLGALGGRVYHGSMGAAPFQSLYRGEARGLLSLSLSPEWYLVVLALLALSVAWSGALPLLAFATAIPIAQAVLSALHGRYTMPVSTTWDRARQLGLTALMHLLQPLARLAGRLRHGLSPWRRRGAPRVGWPWLRPAPVWSEQWRAPEAWVDLLAATLREQGTVVTCGGPYDRWDLEARGGFVGGMRLLTVTEEHGEGKQQIRIRVRPRVPLPALMTTGLGATLAVTKWMQGSPHAALGMILVTLGMVLWLGVDCGRAARAVGSALNQLRASIAGEPR